MAEPTPEAESSAPTTEPVAAETDDGAARTRAVPASDVPVAETDDASAEARMTPAAETDDAPAETRVVPIAETDRAGAETRAIPAPVEPGPVLEPAEPDAPAAPRVEGNRLVGTAWVLLAAGLFQLLYFGALAGLIALLAATSGAGAQLGRVVAAQLQQYFVTPFAWLPVLFFFLLFELTVLLFNRAGRFLYVVASMIVGVVTYVVSVLLISILVRGSVGDASTLEQTFLIPQFILIGLISREVMLWTGVAIGARGRRVRRRNRARREAYLAETGGGAAA